MIVGDGPYRHKPRLAAEGSGTLQGVIKAYDPGTKEGVVTRDTDRSEHELAPDALDGSVFRMLRQGQRVVFDLDDQGRAAKVRLGSEVDMGTPGYTRQTGQR